MGRRRFATAQVLVILSAVVTALSQGAVRDYGEKINTELPPTGRNITYRCIGLQCIASDSNNNHFEAADSFMDPHQFDTMLYRVTNNGNARQQALECPPNTPYESCLPKGIGACYTDSSNRDPYQCGRKPP
ncbi:hypothetical protein HN51_006329 [Arachis hypogaea]|nr:uncharacterized protein DS421_14g487520 [Arachis hypogaea]